MANLLDPKTGLTLSDTSPDLEKQGRVDVIPPVDRDDLTGLNEDHLKSYIYAEFRDILQRRFDYGWVESKVYSIKSYYGIKNEAMKHWPHEMASAFPVPLTPTLLDTAWANIQAGLFINSKKPVTIEGVGDEDIRPAAMVSKFQNWQLVNEMKIEKESDKNVFRTFLYGKGVYKVMLDIKTGTLKIRSIAIENFHVPIDASGVQRGETDIIVHLIPLSYNDIQLRKAMKVYRSPDLIMPGAGLERGHDERITQTIDNVSGQDMTEKRLNQNYYIAECDVLGYVPPDAYRPIDLKVWVSPKGFEIQRIRKIDKGMKTPYAVADAYMYDDSRFYSMSLPEKVKNEQEKVDYADKQYTDSLDIASRPAMFADDTSEFQRGRMQRERGGIYPKGKGNTIDWEPQPPVDRNSAQERALIWEMAERKTGIIDITQGRASAFGGKTLGELEIRAARADVRFSRLLKNFGEQLQEVNDIAYELNYYYTPKEKIMDVIGYSTEGYTMNELFPVKNGELVKHNFQFTGKLYQDKLEEDERQMAFLDSQMTSFLVANDLANTYNVSQAMANLRGVRNFSQIVRKPREARIVTVEEFIQRIVSGDTTVSIRPGIDTEDYLFELQLFKRGRLYGSLEQFQKTLIDDTIRRAYMMRMGEIKSKLLVQRMVEQQFGAGSGVLSEVGASPIDQAQLGAERLVQ